jgi:hypothetical protein
MKQCWMEILSKWKDECMQKNKNVAILPKQELPAILKKTAGAELQ